MGAVRMRVQTALILEGLLHSDAPIHCRASIVEQAMLQVSKSEKNETNFIVGWLRRGGRRTIICKVSFVGEFSFKEQSNVATAHFLNIIVTVKHAKVGLKMEILHMI